MTPEFWRNRRVLLTGHTGFKGSWLTLWLEQLGADVTGFSLPPATNPSLFETLAPWPALTSVEGDLRTESAVAGAVESSQPEIVIHMAAQSLVRASYEDPIDTFGTNVMGTVRLLDALRAAPTVRAVLVVTSDKVYDQDHGTGDFVEGDRLGGSDPYSASKAAQEIVTCAYSRSYLADRQIAAATARAGNVIGGGDWAADRLIPDYFRSVRSGNGFELRYPHATRPWQHVLDPLHGYLTYLEHLVTGDDVPTRLNFGPDEPPVTVAEVITRLAAAAGRRVEWDLSEDTTWPEHDRLRLDSAVARKVLNWRPQLSLDEALRWTAEWYEAHLAGEDMRELSIAQLDAYGGLAT